MNDENKPQTCAFCAGPMADYATQPFCSRTCEVEEGVLIAIQQKRDRMRKQSEAYWSGHQVKP